MKKILISASFILLLLTNIPTINAAGSGACSGHNGVSCSAGADTDGSVICNDGWTDSSVQFSEATDLCTSEEIGKGLKNKPTFSDVPGTHKNSTAIQHLKANKIIDGYPDGTFKPNGEINRAELIKMVVEMMIGDPTAQGQSYQNCFPDVTTEWFAPHVCYAKQMGWVKGYEDGNFKPANNTNRAEAMKIILNAFFNGESNIDDLSEDEKESLTIPTDLPANAWYYKFLAFGLAKDLLDQSHITILEQEENLNFKKYNLNPSEEQLQEINEKIDEVLERLESGEDLKKIAKELESEDNALEYENRELFAGAMAETFANLLSTMEPGEYTKEAVSTGGNYKIDQYGNLYEDQGLSIIKLIEKQDDAIKYEKAVTVNHILVAYDGAQAEPATPRTKEEALILAEDIVTLINTGADFEELAKEYSDDTSTKDQGGALTEPVADDGTYVQEFQDAALLLEQEGQISAVVETQFGYHLIEAVKIEYDVTEPQYHYQSLTFLTVNPEPWQDTGIQSEHITEVNNGYDEASGHYVLIKLNEEGKELLAKLTAEMIGEMLGIFAGDTLITSPVIQEKITDGHIVISGDFTQESTEALKGKMKGKVKKYKYHPEGNITRKEVAETIYRLIMMNEQEKEKVAEAIKTYLQENYQQEVEVKNVQFSQDEEFAVATVESLTEITDPATVWLRYEGEWQVIIEPTTSVSDDTLESLEIPKELW